MLLLNPGRRLMGRSSTIWKNNYLQQCCGHIHNFTCVFYKLYEIKRNRKDYFLADFILFNTI